MGELKTNSVDDNKNESSKHIEEKSHSEVQTPNVSLTDIIPDFKQEENTSVRKGNPKDEDVPIKDIAKQILSADLESLGKNMNEKSQSIGEKEKVSVPKKITEREMDNIISNFGDITYSLDKDENSKTSSEDSFEFVDEDILENEPVLEQTFSKQLFEKLEALPKVENEIKEKSKEIVKSEMEIKEMSNENQKDNIEMKENGKENSLTQVSKEKTLDSNLQSTIITDTNDMKMDDISLSSPQKQLFLVECQKRS